MKLEYLEEIRRGLNELINQRWIYINSETTPENQRDITKQKMILTYDTLGEVLKLIGEEESK